MKRLIALYILIFLVSHLNAQPNKAIMINPLGLFWGVMNVQYEFRYTSENSIAVRANFVGYDIGSFSNSAFGLGGSYRWYSKDEFKNFLEKLWKEHHRASHICYAYQLDEKNFHYNDDGEPSGTAGQRIYSALKIKNLLFVALFVVRYFGGIKLGTGPLAKAYFDASINVLNKAEIVEKYFTKNFDIKLSYNQFEKLKKHLIEFSIDELKPIYSDNVELKISVRESLVKKFLSLIKENNINIHRLD